MTKLIKNMVSSKIWKIGVRIYHALNKIGFDTIQHILFIRHHNHKKRVFIVATQQTPIEQINEIKKRCAFYIPDLSVEILNIGKHQSISPKIAYSTVPLLVFSNTRIKPLWIYRYKGMFNVNYLQNYYDGWEWHHLLTYVSEQKDGYLLDSKNRFVKRVQELKKNPLSKCYIFGTGPSLEKAINRDWSDGYRVVCNTIVRDQKLWKHLEPHFIVAGDAIYHFGCTTFAKTFRKDLAKRLSESNTMFLYPAIFHELVIREFSHFAEQLIPVPWKNHPNINVDLTRQFELPRLGNVLNLLLLPLGCSLSKEVNLFGFDGRAPKDKLFWSNSNKHNYPELMTTLQTAHPAFFEHYVDKSDPQKYVKSFQGDLLDQKMSEAENEGWKFVMLHKSWTPTLQKRHINRSVVVNNYYANEIKSIIGTSLTLIILHI
jgi:hypothetical protein